MDLPDVLAACAFGEAVDFSLRYECSMRPYPGLVDVKMLHSILLLVLPLHVFLLVANGIPPNIQKPIRPCTPVDEEGPQIEASTILRDDKIDRTDFSIPIGRTSLFVQVGRFERVGDIERVVKVDVAVCVTS